MITNQIDGKVCRSTFASLNEFADYAEPFISEIPNIRYSDPEWVYGERDHHTYADAWDMARMGWTSKQDAALELAESAITEVMRDVEVIGWVPTWDVQGSTVDVGQYLAGEPECMIDFPPVPVPATGRVVSICT